MEMDQQPLQTKMEKHGIEYDNLSLISKMASAPVIEVIHLYDDIDLNPEVVKRARFVDDKGQEIAPSQENSVERSLDLAYEAGLPTAPAQIQANGKTYTYQSADKGELTSHKLHVSNLVTVTYFYKEVTTPVVEKPVTPQLPEKPVQKLRLPKGNNGAKTRIPVKKGHTILAVDYL